MDEKYFVVSMNEDGEWSLYVYDATEEGKRTMMRDFELDRPDEDFTVHPAAAFTDHIDYNKPGCVLIKGRVIIPKPREIATYYEIE